MARAIAGKHKVFELLAPMPRPPYDEVWHLWAVIVPRRSITGRLLWGTVLRRRDDGRWIYKKYIASDDASGYRKSASTLVREDRNAATRRRPAEDRQGGTS